MEGCVGERWVAVDWEKHNFSEPLCNKEKDEKELQVRTEWRSDPGFPRLDGSLPFLAIFSSANTYVQDYNVSVVLLNNARVFLVNIGVFQR